MDTTPDFEATTPDPAHGTGPDARMRSTGNIGVNSGGAASNNGVTPEPAASGELKTTNNQPPQTPIGPGGGTGGAGSGTAATGTGSFQGSTTGNESGAGVRTNETNSGNRAPANNNGGNASGGNGANGAGSGQ